MSLFSIPRAVCKRYKPDRQHSGRGLELLAPVGTVAAWKSGLSPLCNPQAGAVYPPAWCARSRRRWRRLAPKVLGCWAVAPLLPPGSLGKSALYSPACLRATACWGQKKRNQEEEEHLTCHAALPRAPHAAAGVTRVEFKEFQQRQLFGLPCMRVTVSPPQASSFPLPGLASSWACLLPAASCTTPQGACPSLLLHQDRRPYLGGVALDGTLTEPLL